MNGERAEPDLLMRPSFQDRLENFADWLSDLSGWRRLLMALLFGALSATAFPPVYLLFFLPVAFAGLLWLLPAEAGKGRAFAVGWAFGTGHFLVGLYWIGIALTVDIERFGWLLPFPTLGLALGLGLFVGVVTLALQIIAWRGRGRVLLFVALWLLAEVVRGLILTGFPWNLMGSVWSFSAWTLQPLAWVGTWGLGAVTLLATASPVLLVGRRKVGFVFLSWGLLAVLLAAGAVRLGLAPPPGAEVVPEVQLRLVQPSIPQQDKWKRDLRRGHVYRQMQLSVQPGFENISHLIWAETAVPYFLNRQPDLRRSLAQVVPPSGRLLVGAPTLLLADEASAPLHELSDDQKTLYNSLFVLNRLGETEARYDKKHLVPFGEYMPLRSLLGFTKLTAGRSDFSSGTGAASLPVAGLPLAAPLICYEIIFPGQVVSRDGPRPAWLLNLTNDAWFGRSSGPHQHFAAARMRAVEEGLPLVRVANNGISAIVDPQGRVLGRLEQNQQAVLDGPLPKALPRTLFSYLGLGAAGLLLLIFFIPAWLLRRG
ncbi:apolipoprotein N-acyltransferase [Rhodovibrionaceae bacterium A322]